MEQDPDHPLKQRPLLLRVVSAGSESQAGIFLQLELWAVLRRRAKNQKWGMWGSSHLG